MNIRILSGLALLLCTLTNLAQPATPDTTSSYPILGYYRLGMTVDPFTSQGAKLREATEVPDATGVLPLYLMEIGGIAFDVDNKPGLTDIDAQGYAEYSPETQPLYFTGGAQFLDGRLASLTFHTLPPDDPGEWMCYMPAVTQAGHDLPAHRCLFDVLHPELHNRLVRQADSLTVYLSQRYGAPAESHPVALLARPKPEDVPLDNLKALWYSRHPSGAVLPRALWHQGSMTIIMGIANDATLFISFLDEQALSHPSLDSYFAPTAPPRPRASW